jgi:hypothetical protein
MAGKGYINYKFTLTGDNIYGLTGFVNLSTSLSHHTFSSSQKTMKIGLARYHLTLLGLTFQSLSSQAFIAPTTRSVSRSIIVGGESITNNINSRMTSSSPPLEMARGRGLERLEEGATPLREKLDIVVCLYGFASEHQ